MGDNTQTQINQFQRKQSPNYGRTFTREQVERINYLTYCIETLLNPTLDEK